MGGVAVGMLVSSSLLFRPSLEERSRRGTPSSQAAAVGVSDRLADRSMAEVATAGFSRTLWEAHKAVLKQLESLQNENAALKRRSNGAMAVNNGERRRTVPQCPSSSGSSSLHTPLPTTSDPPTTFDAASSPVTSHTSSPSSSGKGMHTGTAGGSSVQPYWLIIGIPTVPRPGGTKGLHQTLLSLRKQIYDAAFRDSPLSASSVHVVVMNQRPGHHHELMEAEKKWQHEPWISFVENRHPLSDVSGSSIDDGQGGGDATAAAGDGTTAARIVELRNSDEWTRKRYDPPSDKVRRQSLDVVSLLRHVAGKSRYFLFYEDDFHFCENALMALHYMIARANDYIGVNEWAALRCGMGLTGIVMQNGGGGVRLQADDHGGARRETLAKGSSGGGAAPGNVVVTRHSVVEFTASAAYDDVAAFAHFVAEHYWRRPPDHLAVEWYAKESKPGLAHYGADRHVMAFRYNLFRHDGRVSTLRDVEAWDTPGCFHELIAPLVFPVEAWDPVECAEDDLWPCQRYATHRKSLLVWNNSTEALVSRRRDVFRSEG